MMYTQTLEISPESLQYYNRILNLTGRELYDRYGLKRDETITYTAEFHDGCQMDIRIVICEEDSFPYIDVVLFDAAGCELNCAADDRQYDGVYELEGDNEVMYQIIIK